MQQPTGFSLANTAVADRSLASLFSGIATGILPSTNADSLADYQRPKPTRSTSVDPRIVPLTIPPTHTNRTLVLCFDGTGDQFDNDNSNIVKFVSLLKKDDNKKQMVYYQVCVLSISGLHIHSLLRTRRASEHTRHRRLQTRRRRKSYRCAHIWF